MTDHDPLHVLLVDDDEDNYALIAEMLRESQATRFEVEWVQQYDRAVERLGAGAGVNGDGIDACLIDYRVGGRNGIDLVREARVSGCDLPMILLMGQGDREVDLEAMKAGASDFLRKETLAADGLERSIRHAVQRHHVERERNELLLVAQARAEQLRELAKQLTQAEQRERQRVAQTLHDHLQQLLVAARMQMSAATGRVTDAAVQATLDRVDDLLEQSIAASRSLSLQLSPPVLKDRGLVPALQWLARSFQEGQGLKVEVVAQEGAAADLPIEIGDFVFQAVRELLFNVAKHSGTHEAEIRVTQEDPVNEAEEGGEARKGGGGGWVQVEVRDRGLGVDPENLRDESAAEGGFGLFTIRQRLGFFGGEFTIEGGRGDGCVATMRVPLTASARAKESIGKASLVRSDRRSAPAMNLEGTLRVLLADDHKILRQGLAHILGGQPDIEIVGEVGDGEAAVLMAGELRPDVVVIDVSMPRVDGIEATRRIKAEGYPIRIVALSMHNHQDMEKVMRDAGAEVYLTKGCPSDVLIAAVRGVGV